jgi:hypothetical protein
MYLTPMGDTAPQTTNAAPSSFSLRDTINSEPVSTASAILLTYHGYRRTGSIFWALVWGAMGKWKPVYTMPVAVAQGFGQRKACP